MLKSLRQTLQPKVLFPSLAVGGVIGIQNAILILALAVMVFSGELSQFITIGITVLFVGSLVQAVVVALGSSLPGMMSMIQDSPAVILALVAAFIVSALPNASPETKFYTTLAAIMLSTVLNGLVYLLLGKFKLGNLVSYMPYPVIGGFLAGTGLLLVLGAFQVMTGKNVSLLNLGPLFEAGTWFLWVPGVLFALVLFGMVLKINHYLVLPGVLAVTLLLFYLGLAVTHTSLVEATRLGWMVSGIPQGGSLFKWWDPAGFALVDWRLLLSQSGSFFACLVISLLSLLLNLTAIGLATGQEIDLNTELTNNGWANLLSGLIGSSTGYPMLGATSMGYKLGARVRLNGVVAAAVIGLALFLGGSFLGSFPNLLLGGLLFFVGLDFIYSWLYQTWITMPKLDYAVLVVIALLIIGFGFLTGVGVGLALTVMLFVIQYSRVPTIRHIFSGINYQSSVDRSRLHTQILRQKGNWLYILELQGFIFFGTANRILDQIREHLDSTSTGQPTRYLILDFRLVTGADSSVGFSFAKILRLAQTRQIALVLTNVSAQIKKQLIPQLPAESVAYFPDLDHGIEWCENAMVASFENTDLSTEPASLFAQLLKAMPTPAEVEILRPYLQLRDFQPGECIIQQGSLQAGLHMIEKGQVSILLECEDGSRLRLRSLSSGAFFGEMGLYTCEPASAWVIAEQATSLYQLRAEDLELLEQTAPEVAAALHRFVAAYLSERLAKMTNTIQAVMR